MAAQKESRPSIPFRCGFAVDLSGTLYAITSPSRDREGDEKKSRNKLVRFRIEGERLTALTVIDGLKPALVSAHPLLAAAAEVRDVKTGGGFNIEALEISPDQQRLLVGFRSPLLDRHAVKHRAVQLNLFAFGVFQ